MDATFERASQEEIAALAAFSPPTLHEAMGQRGAMPACIKPIYPGMKLAGSALTVRCKPGDNLAIHVAAASAQPGDVLVVDNDGFVESGPFGDVLATACQARGVVGLVIDGCVRDGPCLREMGFPVFSRGLAMKGAAKTHPGEVGVPIVCAGVAVSPGDVVIGDDDGVVVVPRALIALALKAAREREDTEDAIKEKLKAGATTLDLLGLRPLLERAG
ncbi:4-carboxy-4-hydroxy-2-oxoadipate aldolase/oxaloacetate decarboxylase [Inquilinus limosus]|uniref:4-carboxy-4-hydroxy-2-oxoadipate aldolase/oxaloacetate decarboxylase n=1 Tax=Inquilinus limosus TaxID=171674 RepID=UPI003F15D83B